MRARHSPPGTGSAVLTLTSRDLTPGVAGVGPADSARPAAASSGAPGR
jgi:hypothetical protein